MAEREKSTGFATICDRNFQEAVEALGERERDIEKFRAQVKEVGVIIYNNIYIYIYILYSYIYILYIIDYKNVLV